MLDETSLFRRLLWHCCLGLLICALLVTLCFFFVDRPVAFFVRDHHLGNPMLRTLTEMPMLLNALAPAIALLAVFRRACGPLDRWERTLLAGSISLMIAIAFEWYLKALFGRYWPGTWINDNPSLLDTGDYGFHPFHFGEAYGSFPSGHTARVFAMLSVVWIAYPGWRWLCVLLWASVVVGLVGMNYHFVGDTIGGACLGALTGACTTRFFGLDEDTSPAGSQ